MPETPEPARRAKDNERPLREDIRLLGRILGDTVREQEGAAAFELVERVRKLSVAFRRDADHEADRAVQTRSGAAPSRAAVTKTSQPDLGAPATGRSDRHPPAPATPRPRTSRWSRTSACSAASSAT